MQFHQGSRLKKIIEKSGKKKVEIIAESGVSNGTLYKMFELSELEKLKILPILKAVGLTYDEFIGDKKSGELVQLQQRITELENENKKLLLDKIALLEKLESERELNKKNAVRSRAAI